MGTKLKRLQDEALATVKKAKDIVETAELAGREMNSQEKTDYDVSLKRGNELLAAMNQEKADQIVLDQAAAFAYATQGKSGPGTATGGAKAWAAATAERVKSESGGIGYKALSAGVDVPTILDTGNLNGPAQVTDILDLIGTEDLAGNTFTYVAQTVRDNKAAPVADGALKPTSRFDYGEKEGRARVIAHLSEPFPERYLEDYKGLTGALEEEMYNGVREQLEYQVLSGDGTGENFPGLGATSGILTQPFVTDVLTTLRKARTIMQSLREAPTAYVISPADDEAIDLLRATTGGQFLDIENRIFGDIPKVVSTSVPAGTAWLGDWSKAMLLTRQTINVKTRNDGELFDHNQVKLRGEGRFGFAVTRPQAFMKITLGA